MNDTSIGGEDQEWTVANFVLALEPDARQKIVAAGYDEARLTERLYSQPAAKKLITILLARGVGRTRDALGQFFAQEALNQGLELAAFGELPLSDAVRLLDNSKAAPPAAKTEHVEGSGGAAALLRKPALVAEPGPTREAGLMQRQYPTQENLIEIADVAASLAKTLRKHWFIRGADAKDNPAREFCPMMLIPTPITFAIAYVGCLM